MDEIPSSENDLKADSKSDPVENRSGDGRKRFPIVGIGASAGGLAAFESFFSTMPKDSEPGISFVLVQHLARNHKSILSDLIRRYTAMEVFDVEDDMQVRPNCVYIIPPNRDMELADGKLRLFEPTLAHGIRLPIDLFFRSLAQDQREHAICIVLSGTGSDGTLGVRAVKGEGGLVMVQTPETAEFDGMPRSAIATGMVDLIVPSHEMPARLLAYVAHAFGTPAAANQPHPAEQGDNFEKIFMLLRRQTGHDFSLYKRNTIRRRVERRMAIHQVDQLDAYIRYLELTPGEIEALFRDLLIGVTNFFRDTDIFEEIQKQILPRLLAGKPADSAIRAWVAGCSTGEEAYSLAILLREYMDDKRIELKVTIFATDIDRESIEHARAGVFPSSVIADISPERLAHFFTPENPDGSSYRIRKRIRDMIIFSEHDLTRDPPFSKLDLISCRNLLIYMGAELQKRMVPLFHYALRPGGVLLLGSSESIGEFVDLFSPLDRRAKIHEKIVSDWPNPSLRVLPRLLEHEVTSRKPGLGHASVPLHEIALRTLMAHYAPVGALVNERGDILYLLGRTGRYLEPTPGEPVMNIFRMAREGLRGDLTLALHRAISLTETVKRPGLRVRNENATTAVNLTVIPVADTAGVAPHRLFLVVLQEDTGAGSDPAVRNEQAVDAIDEKLIEALSLDEYILRLKQELRSKDEYLQTAFEELETSNEELRSAHEEMQSVNEEMQSTNEELETSKEELQSVNEELATVNSELQAKVADLSRSNSDMRNLLSGTGIGTIFVDHLLRILRFTPTVSTLINLIEADIGRPLDQIRSNLVGYDALAQDIREVLGTLTSKELEVQTQNGEWFLLRIRPYRTLDNVIEGAVITFTEITAMKQAQAFLRDSEAVRRLAIVVRDTRDAVLVYDMTGRILAWNPAAEKLYGWTEEEALAMNIRNLLPESGREDTLASIRRLSELGRLEPQRIQRVTKDGQFIPVSVTSSMLVDSAGKPYAIATTERCDRDEVICQ
jgi:two-component system CheB/CheR fusion protein